MPAKTHEPHRLCAATALHQGDRATQQDQVKVLAHPRLRGCVLGVLADGMGGKSGGRAAANQVVMTAEQVFERFDPGQDTPDDMLRQMAYEAHAMIRLTAITAEAEPHSTLAAFLLLPGRKAYTLHAGDSRVHHFRGDQLASRTLDHSYVQRLVSEGRLSEEEARNHPRANLLLGCLGTESKPPAEVRFLGQLAVGDSLLACSDGLWQHVSQAEMGAMLEQADDPAEATQRMVALARERGTPRGDNLSLALVRLMPRPATQPVPVVSVAVK